LLLGAFFLLALPCAIYQFGKKAALPDTFLSRYGPFIAPILFTLVVWLIIAFLNGSDFSEDRSGVTVALIVFLPFFVFLSIAIFSGTYWLLPIFSTIAYLFFLACFAAGTWRGKRFKTQHNKTALFALALILALVFAALAQRHMHYRDVLAPSWDSDHPVLSEHIKHDLSPFSGRIRASGVELVFPKTPPSLQIDRDYPKLDGAVALIPIYAAAANAIYQTNTERTDSDAPPARINAVRFSETSPAAYKALLDGRADMIFAGAPSEEQVKEAAEKGITYTLTPIAREAFVFLVNDQNPVANLSDEQIRSIYSGKINNWKEVGGAPGRIMAFQRNEGSGSQSAMLRVMRGTPMRKPLEAEYTEGMGGLIRNVAEYRNMDHAIG
jgi:phosphate transport system substrate-binding protein